MAERDAPVLSDNTFPSLPGKFEQNCLTGVYKKYI